MLQAVYLMTASKKGISAHQLHRVLEVTYKTAWFLAHRIREATSAAVRPVASTLTAQRSAGSFRLSA
jgi:hypothetical protein